MAKTEETKKTVVKRKRTKKKEAGQGAAEEQQPRPENSATKEQKNDTNKSGGNGNGKTAKQLERESTHAKYERVKRGNLHLMDLQKLTVAELDLGNKSVSTSAAINIPKISCSP